MVTFKDVFEYASNNLLHKNKGFEKLETILSQKTMYALRLEASENVRLSKARDLCGPNAGYIGSHDALLFRLLTRAPSQLLAKINYSIIMRGIEQVIMTASRGLCRITELKIPVKSFTLFTIIVANIGFMNCI